MESSFPKCIVNDAHTPLGFRSEGLTERAASSHVEAMRLLECLFNVLNRGPGSLGDHLSVPFLTSNCMMSHTDPMPCDPAFQPGTTQLTMPPNIKAYSVAKGFVMLHFNPCSEAPHSEDAIISTPSTYEVHHLCLILLYRRLKS